jgi:AsmA protein
MRAIAKLLGIVVVAVVVLVVGAMVLVSFFFDPNDYKNQIAAAVADATGRELTLDGDLELEIFPTLRIAVGSASLSNAPGFGNEPFAHIEAAALQLGLLPLLSRRVEIGEARLIGLDLNLARDARGNNNWQDLAGGGNAGTPAAGAAEAGGTGGEISLDVGAIEIADARIHWSDATTGEDWVLDNFSFDASNFGEDVAFPVSLGFDLAGNDVQVTVAATMDATLSLASNTYRLEDLDVDIDGSGAAWPGGSGEAEASFGAFVADLDAETLDLQDLRLDILGMSIRGNLAGTRLLSDLRLSGGIEIEPFDPQDVLEILDSQIETADSDVLREASASANFNYAGNRMGLSNMRLALDDSTLTGSIGLAGNALEFNLAVDAINIDRYLPPAEEQEVEDEGSLDEVDLPIDPLRNFVASGSLALRQAQFLGLSLTDASFDLTARNGRMTITPQASLYGGTYSGSIGLQVASGDAATLTLVQDFKNLDLLPFLRDYLDSDMLSGTGELHLDVSATGSNLGEMQRALDGDVSFRFANGAWEGIDVWYELRRARAVLNKEQAPARPAGEPRTPFQSIAASGVVEDAVLTNRDLTAALPFMSVSGGGTINLLTDAMDLRLKAKFVDGPAMQEAPEMAGLIGGELPITIGGTLDAPSIKPEFGAVVRQRVQQEVQEEVDEKREELEDRARDRVRDRLRGLFN